MAILNGLNADTSKHLQLDSGVLLHSLSPGDLITLKKGAKSDDDGVAFDGVIKQKTLGATKGGATFSAIPEMRSLLDGVNGARGNYKEGQVIDSWEISIKATVSEITAANIGYALSNNKFTDESPYTKFKGEVGRINKTNFLGNIAWIGSMNGNDKPIIIIINNALNTHGMTFVAEDKNTGSIEMELKGHFSLEKPDDVPFEIYIPNIV